jgi:DNA-binding response OmpR family regulator
MSTILIIDDERSIRDMLQDTLEDEGYTVQTVGDGASGLLAIHASCPDLVLLDGTMPVMNGEELLKELRSSDFPQLPIIMLTANRFPERYLTWGANAALAKPFLIDALLQLIKSLLGSAEAGLALHSKRL